MIKPRIAILTIYPFDRGGQLTSLKVVHDFCKYYFEPTVFFLGFDRNISANLKAFRFRSTMRSGKKLGMNYVEVGSRWAFWPPRLYLNTLSIWKKLFKYYNYFFVSAGTPFTAYPLILLKKKFVMYIPSTYEEDSKERISQLRGFRYVIERLALKQINKIEKEIIKKANFIFPFSSYTKGRFEKILGYQRDNMEICGHHFNVPQEFESYENRKNILLAVGRFDDERKNISMLLRVFKKIFEMFPEFYLYIVGTKPSQEKLVLWKECIFFRNVIFTGRVSDNELHNYYRESKVFLITSYQEGFGIAGLEALSYGVPVVSTNCGGTREFIEEGKNGFLVSIDDDETMIDSITIILRSSVLWQEMSLHGRKIAIKYFAKEKIHTIFKKGISCVYPELRKIINV